MSRKNSLRFRGFGRRPRSGSALLIILGCVALLTVLVLSFFVTSRTEFTSSNFYARGVNTELLSENVINLVEAQLREGARSSDLLTSQPVAWVSQPGMIRTYDNAGLAHMVYKLYSSDTMNCAASSFTAGTTDLPDMSAAGWAAQPNVYTDLNEPITTAGGGTEYPIIDPNCLGSVEGFAYTAQNTANGTTNPLPMPVKWLYVLKNGTLVTGTAGTAGAASITGASLANPIIGRVAFWTDDETSKVNINTASEGTFWDSPIGNNLQEHGLLGNLSAAQNAAGGSNTPGQVGYAEALPASQEYQAIPGHPATTSLSPVFGFGGAPLPDTSLNNASLQYPLYPGTTGNYATYFSPYFSLTPRYQSGASMGGSQYAQSVAGNVASTFFAPGYRLYDSVDELVYDPARLVIYSGGPNASLYTSASGASPTGRQKINVTPQIVDQRRFFITAHSRAPEETLFGTPRVSLWPLQAQTAARTAKDNLLAFCTTINGNPYYFQRATYFQYQTAAGGPVTTNQQATIDGNVISNSSSQDADQDFSGTVGLVGSPTATPVAAGTATLGNVARNQNLYAYLQAMTGGNSAGGPTIPGFGGTFYNKYPGGPNGSGTQTSDRDQILTEMFDYLRSGVNTFDVDPTIYPHYSFSPFYANSGSYPVAYLGGGSTVPIQIASQGGTTANTYGMGRNYSIAEVALGFMASNIDLNDGALHPGETTAIPLQSAGALDPTNSASLTQTGLRRISIGANLPWACEEDYWAGSTRIYLYYDSATKSYGNYYLALTPTLPPVTTAYIYPATVPATPVPVATSVPVPVFYYWDTATNPGTGGSYFRAPPTDTLHTGLFICNSPSNPPAPGPTLTALPNTAVTIGDPQTTAVQPYIIVRPFTALPGNPAYAPNVRIRITHLESLKVAFPWAGAPSVSLGFPPGPNAVECINTENGSESTTDGGLIDAWYGHSTADPSTGANNGTSPACNDNSLTLPWTNDGTKPSTLVATTPNYSYPFVGVSVPTTAPAYPSPFGGQDPFPCPPGGSTNSIPNSVQFTPPSITPPSPTLIHYAYSTSNPNNYAGNTMDINGTQLQIDVLDGTTKNINQAQVLESLQVTIPPMTGLPVPTVEMANGVYYDGNEGEVCGNPGNNQGGPRLPGYTPSPFSGAPSGGATYQAPYNHASPPNPIPTAYTYTALEYYWQLPYNAMNIACRFAKGLDRIVNRGDVVRSFVVNPNSKVEGDMRMLAANPLQTSPALAGDTVPAFIPLGSALTSYPSTSTVGPYLNPFIKQLHTLMTDFGNGRSIANLIITNQNLLAGPTPALPNPGATPIGAGNVPAYGGGIAQTGGAMFSGYFYPYETAPVCTPELTGAYMDPSAKTIPGDWTLGIGDDPDGGFTIKADEGETQTGYSSPYYSTNVGNEDFAVQNISYSPARQVPSAVMFGTLPSRVMQGVPWCTLLFCPNPSANDAGAAHPGFGTDTAGNTGPAAAVPYAVPPDHLFLDLFWMPVVEPYAISEPFSTAGKVNLNYQIVPFSTYIHRSTALHAVLKSTRILAIATNFNSVNPGNYPCAKTVGLHTDNPGSPYGNYSMRYGINLAATIDDFATTGNPSTYIDSAFYQRFDTNHDLFRSASEICNIFLVPQQVPGSTYPPTSTAPLPPTDGLPSDMISWWKNFKLTGDNGRESPYNQIYPRLTTKSNTFQVHMRVQTLAQIPADRAAGTFNAAAGDSVTSEYRGSAIVERYIDPNQTSPTPLPDFATTFAANPSNPGPTGTVDNYVRYRVVSTHAFAP